MGFTGLVSFSRDLQRRDPGLTAMAASLRGPVSPADATIFRRTAAFAHQGVTGSYADWRHPRERDPDCMVVVDAVLTDRALLEQKLYGTRRPRAATAEVVLHAYRRWGASLTGHLRGNFSIVVWDAVLQRLLLLRDPFGVKTTFFISHADGLVFSTQATALLAHLGVPASAEHEELGELTTLRPRRPPSCGIFPTVKEVAAGEIVQVTPKSISSGRY